MKSSFCCIVVTAVFFAVGTSATIASSNEYEYLSDKADCIIWKANGWGVMGFDERCKAADDAKAGKININGKIYEKGIGVHANSVVVFNIDGQYSKFIAEVGCQTEEGIDKGSVVFQVFTDGIKVFDSGLVVSGQPAVDVNLPVKGIRHLRLVVRDGGNGITSDLANWGDAKLVKSAKRFIANPTGKRIDIGEFAHVVISDPNRIKGTQAGKVEEYPAEDVFLETLIAPTKDGIYTIEPVTKKQSCIGLNWTEKRLLTSLSIVFAEDSFIPNLDNVKVQGWKDTVNRSELDWGDNSPFIGEWTNLKGNIEEQKNICTFSIESALEGKGANILPLASSQHLKVREKSAGFFLVRNQICRFASSVFLLTR